uniref:Uncharacterized protein n=1 Tax=Rhizophora mucronata TaxID=61149 RepID=A0A2P2R303_RHIMU
MHMTLWSIGKQNWEEYMEQFIPLQEILLRNVAINIL